MSRRRAPVLAGLAIALATVAAAPASGGQQPRNPLAGRWSGMTSTTPTYNGAPAPLSYRITNKGAVVDFTTTVTTNKTTEGLDCATPIQVTVNLPPFKLSRPTRHFPKGKRFVFNGTGVNPPVQIHVFGAVVSPFKTASHMAGGVGAGTSQAITTPSGLCRTGAVAWTARRLR